MNYTQAQIDRANAVSLEDFLRSQGEQLIKNGREYRWKAHESLIVSGNKWWFRHSQSKGGYVMEFYGKSFTEAVGLLTGEHGESLTKPHRLLSSGFPSPAKSPTGQCNIFVKYEVSASRLLRPFFCPGIFMRTAATTTPSLWAGTETVFQDMLISEERQTASGRIFPALTSPMVLAMWGVETSSLPLKHSLICCLSSACIRRNGSLAATLLWAVCPAGLWSVFSLNAGTFRKCSSVWTATPQEVKPVIGCWG